MELVRPGRECKRCGENRRDMMTNHPQCVDGHELVCKRCRADENAAKRGPRVRRVGIDWANRKECALKNQRRRRAEDPERARAIEAAQRAKDPEGTRARKARRRSKLAEATCTPATRLEVLTLSQGCPCGGAAEHLDHIVPVKVGGCAHLHNLQWLCRPCNQRKSAKLPPNGTGCPVFWEQQEESP